jgi:hypothetical protein
MTSAGAAQSEIATRWLGPRRWLAALVLGAGVHTGVAAAGSIDCAGINMGQLDVVLASGSSALRTVEMQEGDTLAFTFRADAGATGSVVLVGGHGPDKRLLHGRHATHATFTADRSGPVGFRLTATGGGAVAIFVTTCAPAHGPDATASGGLNVDMSVPLAVSATTAKVNTPAKLATPYPSTLQWLGGAQSTTDAPTRLYGVNLKLQPAFMIGVLAQFDQTNNPLLGPTTALSDQPWLAGPVTSVQLGGGLSLDARAAWGSTDPVVGHTADRQTLDARLTSKQEAGPWRFSLSIGFAHLQEKLGTADVPLHAVESGRFNVLPEMAYRIDMGHSTYIEPRIMIDTFWSLGDAATSAVGIGGHDARHLTETGVTFGTADGTKLQVGGSVQDADDAGSDKVWTGKVQLSIPLK